MVGVGVLGGQIELKSKIVPHHEVSLVIGTQLVVDKDERVIVVVVEGHREKWGSGRTKEEEKKGILFCS